jgi:Nif-specific regulatory protein
MNREYRQLWDENARLRRELRARHDLSTIVGASRMARELREIAAEASSADSSVLICGEPGAGKELVARAIHYGSSRADKPFVKVHCAVNPESVLDAELFGEKDGVTRPGHPRRADVAGGTLFLDEIDRLTERTQVRLLGILRKAGDEFPGAPGNPGNPGNNVTKGAGVRVVAATTRDLPAGMANGLNAFVIFVPPLRERKGDIPRLANHFLEKFARDHEKAVARLSAAAIDALMNYRWPGNVGELEDAIDRAVLACEGQVIYVRHLPSTLHPRESSHGSLAAAMDAYEKELIEDALKTARGNRARAARLLGTTERIMNYRIKKLEIDHRRFRPAGAAHIPCRVHMTSSSAAPGAAGRARQAADGFA